MRCMSASALSWSARRFSTVCMSWLNALMRSTCSCRLSLTILGQLWRELFQSLLDVLEQGIAALGEGGAEFIQQPTQGVGLHGAHLHQEFALAMQRERGLLDRGLDANEFHARLLRGQPDRTSISGIGLVAGDEGPHRLGVQQAHRVAQRHQFARPVVATPAGLDGDEAGLAIGKVLDDLGALELHVDDLARAHVHRVQLKDVLGNVQPDDLPTVHGANDLSCIHACITIHDGPSAVFVKTLVYHLLGTSMPYPAEGPPSC